MACLARTEIASHRGGAFLWPENSLLAFRNARRRRRTNWNSTSTFPRMASRRDARPHAGPHNGRDRPRAGADDDQLRRVRLKGADGEGVPSLADAAALVRGAGKPLRLEIKADGEGRPYPGIVASILDVLDGLGMRGRKVAMSFQPDRRGGRAAGRLGRVVLLLGPRPWRGMGAAKRSASPAPVAPPRSGCTSASSTRRGGSVRAAGFGVGAWGANHEPTSSRRFASA